MHTWKQFLHSIPAWFVHLYTSLGLIVAFANVVAIFNQQVRLSLLFFLLALFIDASDGTLARLVQVKKRVPGFDGRKLDDITDYINYTFLPILFVFQFHLLRPEDVWVIAVVLISGAYGFCQAGAKTEDHSFTGFPNYWNFLVMYLYWGNLDLRLNAAILLVFALLVWVPIPFISHRTKAFQRITLTLTLLFELLLLVMVLQSIPSPRLLTISLIYPIYYVGVSLYLWQKNHSRMVCN